MKKLLLWPLLGLTILTLASCDKGDPKEKVSEATKKTKPTVDGQSYDGASFSVTVPKTWKVIDFSRGDFEKMIDNVTKEKEYEGMGAMLKGMADNKQFKFFAVMPEYSIAGFAANLNVLELPMPAMATAAQVFKANRDELSRSMGKEVAMVNVPIEGAEAVRFEWSNRIQSSKLATTTIIAVHKDKQAVFTFSVPEAKGASAKKAIDTVVSSITFK